MVLKLECETHVCPVVPAGDTLHFIERKPGTFELDWADLYCTGGTGEHNFRGVVFDSQGNWLAYVGP